MLTVVLSAWMLPALVGFVCLSAMQRFATAQFSVAVGSVAALVATAVVAWAGGPPEAFIAAILGSPLLIASGFTVWVVVGVLRGFRSSDFAIGDFLSMVRASTYYAVFNAGNTVIIGTSTLIVGSVLGLAEAAVFSVALRLFTPIITIIVGSGALLWPSMTEAISRGDVAWARSRYWRESSTLRESAQR